MVTGKLFVLPMWPGVGADSILVVGNLMGGCSGADWAMAATDPTSKNAQQDRRKEFVTAPPRKKSREIKEMTSLLQLNRGGQSQRADLDSRGAGRGPVGFGTGLLGMHVVAHIRTLHPEDDILGDVGGVVGNAFQVASDEQGVQCLTNDFGAIIHGLDELNEGVVPHAIDDVVHFKDGLGEFNLAFDE